MDIIDIFLEILMAVLVWVRRQFIESVGSARENFYFLYLFNSAIINLVRDFMNYLFNLAN